jgi:hypothetical protein
MVQQWPVPTRHLKNPGYNAAQLPLTGQEVWVGFTGHREIDRFMDAEPR